MTDTKQFKYRLKVGRIKNISYDEDKNETSFVIDVNAKINNINAEPDAEEKYKDAKIDRFNLKTEGAIRHIQKGQRVSFLYEDMEDGQYQFKAFVYKKEEIEARLKSEQASNKNRHSTADMGKASSTTAVKEEVAVPESVNTDLAHVRSAEWKKNIPFLSEGKWYNVGFNSRKCSPEQLQQVFRAINESSLSSTLKIGFQSHLAELRDVRYKDIMNIEDEYKKYLQKATSRALGK